MSFFEFGMEILLSRTYSAAFCLPVLFHDVTQRLLYRLGLRATGLVLNVFDTKRMSHSYDNGRNKKHSLGIQVRAAEKRDAGVLYLPPEHWDFCQKVYDGLGVDYRLTERTGEDFLEKADAMSVQPSQITYKNDVYTAVWKSGFITLVWIWSSVSGSCTPATPSGGDRQREFS